MRTKAKIIRAAPPTRATPRRSTRKDGRTMLPRKHRSGRPALSGGDVTTRDVLLDAASRRMNELSSIDISLSELAKHSGLNSALVKYYFGNKEGLMLALLKRDAAKALQELDHLLKMALAPETKIKLHIAAVIDTFHRSPYLNRLLHAMLNDSQSNTNSARQIAAFFVRPFAKLQRKLLDQGHRAGAFRKVEPMFFYVSVLGACDLLFNARFTLRSVFDTPRITDALRKRYVDHVTQMVLQGIATR